MIGLISRWPEVRILPPLPFRKVGRVVMQRVANPSLRNRRVGSIPTPSTNILGVIMDKYVLMYNVSQDGSARPPKDVLDASGFFVVKSKTGLNSQSDMRKAAISAGLDKTSANFCTFRVQKASFLKTKLLQVLRLL